MNTKNNSSQRFRSADRSIVAAAGGGKWMMPRNKSTPIRVLIVRRANSASYVAPPARDIAPDIRWFELTITEPKHVIPALKRQRPDALLLAQDLFDDLGAAELQQLQTRFADLRILLVAQTPTPELYAQILRCRFHGVLPANCPPEACPAAVRAICQGEIWLSRTLLSQAVAQTTRAGSVAETPAAGLLPPEEKSEGILSRREREIAAFVRRGLTNKEIGSRLDIQEDTVKKHMQNIFRKLGVRRRTLVALNQP